MLSTVPRGYRRVRPEGDGEGVDMSDVTDVAGTEVQIGEVAQHLLFENDDCKVWQVDTAPGETFWHHYHNYDYILFHLTEMLGVVYNAPEDHDAIWRARTERGDHGAAEALGAVCYEHSVNYIPGTGFLSPGYVNIGQTTFVAALIEVKRPRRPEQEGVGYSRTDCLVGVPPRQGSVLVLENDRLRCWETFLLPGQSDEARVRADSACYVVDGGRVQCGDGPVEEHPSTSGYWRAAAVGGKTALVNTGDTPYREISVELK